MRVGGGGFGSGVAAVAVVLLIGAAATACSPVVRTPKPSQPATVPAITAAPPRPSASVLAKDVPAPTAVLAAGAATPKPAPSNTKFAVKDALDRTVKFDRLPMRIVVAGDPTPELLDAVYMFPEAPARVVGLQQSGAAGTDFVAQIDPGYGNKTLLDPNVDPVTIQALKPHLAILRTSSETGLGRALQAKGVPVVYLSLATPEAYAKDIAILGAVFGDAGRAAMLAAYFNDHVNRVREAIADLPAAAPPGVLLISYSVSGTFESVRVPPVAWMQTLEVGLAGGEPVWKNARLGAGWTEVSFDQLENWNPQQIYLVAADPQAGEVARQLLVSSTWQLLDAVKQGRVYAFPRDFSGWDQNDPRWLLGLTWLAVHVHPELAATFDMPTEVRAFYATLYALDGDRFDRIVRPMLPVELR